MSVNIRKILVNTTFSQSATLMMKRVLGGNVTHVEFRIVSRIFGFRTLREEAT